MDRTVGDLRDAAAASVDFDGSDASGADVSMRERTFKFGPLLLEHAEVGLSLAVDPFCAGQLSDSRKALRAVPERWGLEET